MSLVNYNHVPEYEHQTNMTHRQEPWSAAFCPYIDPISSKGTFTLRAINSVEITSRYKYIQIVFDDTNTHIEDE